MTSSVGRDVEELECSFIMAGNKKCYSHLETIEQVLKKLNIYLSCDQLIPLQEIYLKEMKT